MSEAWLDGTYPNTTITAFNGSLSGRTSWNNLLRLDADFLAHTPDLIVFDNANDDVGNRDQKAIEGLIRRVWADYPNCRFAFMKVFNVTSQLVDANVNSPVNSGRQAEFEALSDHYGIPIVPVWDNVAADIAAGRYHLWAYLIDTVHPQTFGHGLMSSWLEPYLTPTFLTTPQKPSVLPAYLYDDGSYENAPLIKNGTAYDSKSGTWSENGTTISSSEAGAIVTYSGTFQSIGRPEEDGTVQMSLDGGTYTSITFGPNGYTRAGFTRGAHTVAIKVISGTVTISKFWAI